MSCISEIVSFVANLCTIAAFVIAVILWRTWKKQQNYSFTRDKIFEAELAVSKLHTAQINYFSKHYEYKLKDIPATKVIDPQYYQRIFREAEQLVQSLSVEYDLAIHSLRVLEVNYSEDEIISFIMIESYYMDFVNQINQCEDTESLIKFYWTAISQMVETRKKASKHLASIRKDL